MGVRIFVGHEDGSDYEQAVLFCSSTDTVFGPFFDHAEEAGSFLEWLRGDARLLEEADLESRVFRFRRERENGWKTREEIRLEEEADYEQAVIVRMEILREEDV
tara:strand:- start:8876 stop:9187 length:312 start_codon:yes stop_codon:yes gene_type:complete